MEPDKQSSTNKSSKSQKVKCQEVLSTYFEKFPFLKKNDTHTVLCTICNSVFSISHSGSYDIKTHVNGARHTTLAKGMDKQMTMKSFCKPSVDPSTIRAECLMVSYIIEHNLPLLAADHLSDLIKNIATELSGAKKSFQCKRTKTTYIAKEMSKDCKQQLSKSLKQVPYFSVSTDGSADSGFKRQLYPVLTRYFNPQLSRVVTEVLDIPNMSRDSTGENIFLLMDGVLNKYKLDWGNVMCFCSDNASVMMGKKKGVASFIVQKHPNVFINGCTCHLAAIAAKNAAKKLPVHMEDILVDIMCHMKGSSKRTRELKEIQESCCLPPKMLLAYCATRWLSMGMCIPRLLELWNPLLAFFGNHLKSTKRSADMAVEISKKAKLDETPNLPNLPAASDNPPSTSGTHIITSHSKQNSIVKSSSLHQKPKASVVGSTEPSSHDAIHRSSIHISANKKSSLKSSHSKSRSSSKVRHKSAADSSKSSVKSDESRSTADQSKSSAKSKEHRSNKARFSSTGRETRIYEALSDPRTKLYCLFIKANIGLFDAFNLYLQRDEPVIHELRTKCIELLTDLMVRFIKPSAIKSASGTPNGIFGLKFDDVSVQKSDSDLGIGYEATQFLVDSSFRESDRVEFYKSVRQYFAEACRYIVSKFPIQHEFLIHAEVVDIGKRAQSKFQSVMYFVEEFPSLRKCDVDKLQQEFLRYQVDDLSINREGRIDEQWASLLTVYPNLAPIMLSILSVPHSNADSERIFSAVRRVQTCFRASMDLPLLEALIVVKTFMMTRGEVCYSRKFSDEFLSRAKSCTYVGLRFAEKEEEPVDPMDDVTGTILRMICGQDQDDSMQLPHSVV